MNSSDVQELLAKAISHLKEELSKLQVGRASVGLVDHIMVENYGAHAPLKSMANINIPDAKTIAIQPFDKSTLSAIEKAIQTSPLGVNPSNDGHTVWVNLPPMTEDRRKDLAKVVKEYGEQAHISIRAARQEAREALEKDETLSEDDQERGKKDIQTHVDKANEEVKETIKSKETDILTV